MGSPRFDPSRAVKFDLASGQIDADGSRVVIPADAVMQLWRAAGEDAQRDFGRRIGTEIGRQIAEQLETPAEASTDSMLASSQCWSTSVDTSPCSVSAP